MRGTKKLTYSVIFALVVFLASMFANIVPCQTAPNLPNPEYQWKFCNLNPDTGEQQGLEKVYFGYTSSITTSYLLLAGLSFVAALIAIHFSTKSKKD